MDHVNGAKGVVRGYIKREVAEEEGAFPFLLLLGGYLMARLRNSANSSVLIVLVQCSVGLFPNSWNFRTLVYYSSMRLHVTNRNYNRNL